jgi:hypothetical protein
MKLQLAGQTFTWKFFLADVSMAVLGIDFLRTHGLKVDATNCRLVHASARVFPTTAVTSGPTASVITEASSPPNSGTALAAAGVKLPSGLSAAALSVGRVARPTPLAPAAHQQAGHSSVVPAAQERATVSAVSPALASKLPLFFQLLLQGIRGCGEPF